jgi:hypothetical protein
MSAASPTPAADVELGFLVGRLTYQIEAVERERAQRSPNPTRLAEANADLLVCLARFVLRATVGR